VKTWSPTDHLKHYAHQLQLSAPREWAAFVECFDAYTTDVVVSQTTAAQDEILNMQGRAQAFMHLLRAFRDCHTHPQQNPPPSA
jgi:hypothetical protein